MVLAKLKEKMILLLDYLASCHQEEKLLEYLVTWLLIDLE